MAPRPTPRETFHDAYAPAHPVRYSLPGTLEPDRWLSLNDAAHRLYRVLDIPPAERERYPFATWLREGRTIPTMFALYALVEQEEKPKP